jgi:O-methyltransferase involved in polyketide biosynthesis
MLLPKIRGRSSAAISPTAHYTGYVWARHGLGPSALATRTGALLYNALRPAMAASARSGGPTLEGLLLGRHRAMDTLLTAAIESGRVGQVVEIAAGLSPRGLTYATAYAGRLTYVEADLPAMAQQKRDALARLGTPLPAGHRVVDIDALVTEGPLSLEALLDQLDPAVGTAVITEGLLNYLPLEAVTGLWARLATGLRRFPTGIYLSDLHLAGENHSPLLAGFATMLGAFVRGKIHFHFADAVAATEAPHRLRAGGDQLIRPDPAASGSPIVEPGRAPTRRASSRSRCSPGRHRTPGCARSTAGLPDEVDGEPRLPAARLARPLALRDPLAEELAHRLHLRRDGERGRPRATRRRRTAASWCRRSGSSGSRARTTSARRRCGRRRPGRSSAAGAASSRAPCRGAACRRRRGCDGPRASARPCGGRLASRICFTRAKAPSAEWKVPPENVPLDRTTPRTVTGPSASSCLTV